MKIKLNQKKIAALIGMSASMVLLNGCGHKEVRPITEIVEDVKDTTCFDEAISESTLERIDLLEEYLELSEQLHDLDMDRGIANIEDYSLLAPNDLRIKMLAFSNRNKKNVLSEEELTDLSYEMDAQEQLVNSFICNDGYSIMERATMCGVKSKLLDIKGLDESNYSDITLPASNQTSVDDGYDASVYLDGYTMDKSLNLCKLFVSVYKMQSHGDAKQDSDYQSYEYNPDRNEVIKEAIANLKNTLDDIYTVNKRNVIKKTKKK